ncbi:MAG TPA: DUF4297 domain-containing protein [Gemmatimonadaceae bacterium]|nr:DUF4297 domain-containing protein [Gemmatimonadaceae bacterium]
MDPTFQSLLLTDKAREDSGGEASDRFDFQKNWALCELLRLHETGSDYCMVFERHEDVLVLDSAHTPTQIEFVQVKSTRRSHWTIGQLLQRETGATGKKGSILGKLVGNYVKYRPITKALSLVSNACFRVELADGSDSTTQDLVPIANAASNTQRRLRRSLSTELAPSSVPPYESVTFLVRSAVPLRDHDIHAMGRIADYLAKRSPTSSFPVLAIYKNFFAEVRRRNNDRHQCRTVAEFLERRGITSTEFERMVRVATRIPLIDTLWTALDAELVLEGFDFGTRLRLRRAHTEYELAVLDPANVAVDEFRQAVRRALEKLRPDRPSKKMLDAIRAEVSNEILELIPDKPTDYVEAAILHEYLIFTSSSVSAPNSIDSTGAA